MRVTLLADEPLFVLYGRDHWVALGATALIATALVVWLRWTRRRRNADRARAVTCRALAVLIALGWLSGQVYEVWTGTWTLRESLPLHLCDIGLWVTVLALVGTAGQRPGGWQFLFELAYFWGLGGTLQALLTPDVERPFPHFVSVRFFITHGSIVTAVLAMTLGLGLRPRPRAPLWVWGTTLALGLVVLGLNGLLGSNYMYLCGRPERPSLFDYFGPWPWSLITLLLVGTVFIALWYMPFWIADRVRARRAPEARASCAP